MYIYIPYHFGIKEWKKSFIYACMWQTHTLQLTPYILKLPHDLHSNILFISYHCPLLSFSSPLSLLSFFYPFLFHFMFPINSQKCFICGKRGEWVTKMRIFQLLTGAESIFHGFSSYVMHDDRRAKESHDS